MMKDNSADIISSTAAATNIADAVTNIAAKNWMTAKETQKAEALVSPNEVTSLSALISYVAVHSGEHEFRVARRLSDRFNVANVNCLPAAQFDSAIRYLVDTMVAI